MFHSKSWTIDYLRRFQMQTAFLASFPKQLWFRCAALAAVALTSACSSVETRPPSAAEQAHYEERIASELSRELTGKMRFQTRHDAEVAGYLNALARSLAASLLRIAVR